MFMQGAALDFVLFQPSREAKPLPSVLRVTMSHEKELLVLCDSALHPVGHSSAVLCDVKQVLSKKKTVFHLCVCLREKHI